ncbi:fatty-acid amide hydrolase 1-like isoform X2 [Thamnophis elegans]|uniref:fatty-acid amide hydrolase 1-like isoform X2 n=1 Tax=Thamnophis elegans TaxID=35005 RepID=UPI0013787ECB|nr:fatty-acid amide hydrolase 1-like isoform X2 [Thamnophis elegans]
MRMSASTLVTALLGCSLATFLLLKWRRWRQVQDKIAKARRRREDAFEQMGRAAQRFQEQNPNHQPERILPLSLLELCQKLRDGSLTPDSVFYTYVDKALKVTADVNCIVDYLAENESQLLHMNSEGEKGLLYGVPVSIKESINCKGYDTTLGFAKHLFQPAAEDAVVVQVLKHQGAIPFVKTNVPQSLLNYDCSNPIFGATVHPLNPTKSPGGSSGGEGALIKSEGSILGIGTDIAGSIRIPSAFCGICGLKTTSNRISKKGIVPCIAGQKGVFVGMGPMARDVDGLALCLKALLCEKMFHLDPTVPPLPFNEQVYTSSAPLRIGYHVTNSYSMSSPSMTRAVMETKELLEINGHVLVPFELRHMTHFMNYFIPATLFGDGGAALLQFFEGEPVDPKLRFTMMVLKLPYWMRRFLSWIMRPIIPRYSRTMSNIKDRSVKELWKCHTEIEEYIREFTEEWKRLELDVLLCPAIGPAFKNGFASKVPEVCSNTMLYNYLDFPAGVVPVTTVTKEDEEELKSFKGHYNDFGDKLHAKAVKGAVGLPVAVQCVALPWQEELCLRFMKEVEKLTREKSIMI